MLTLKDTENLNHFLDTVIVIDYVLGNEDKCATIVTTLFERFEYSRFKLRLLLLTEDI